MMLTSCELLNEPFPRALEGRYNAVWTYSAVAGPGAAPGLPTLTCSGGIRIEEADDGVVTGSYTIPSSGDCLVSSGDLTGVVRKDGGLTLQTAEMDVHLGRCELDDLTISLNGVANRHGFEVQGKSPASCATAGIADSILVGSVQTVLTARRR
jgi:hypothetical protein